MKEQTKRLFKSHFPKKFGRPMIKFVKKRNGNKPLTGVGIGVQFGYNAKSMITLLNFERLYLVDPYLNTFDKDNNPISGDMILEKMLKFVPHNHTTFIRQKSLDALDFIHDNLDFVYIDGDHSYDAVKNDINLYYPKVRGGGVIGGHDFDASNLDVVNAVIEFKYESGLKLYGMHKDWWVVKSKSKEVRK